MGYKNYDQSEYFSMSSLEMLRAGREANKKAGRPVDMELEGWITKKEAELIRHSLVNDGFVVDGTEIYAPDDIRVICTDRKVRKFNPSGSLVVDDKLRGSVQVKRRFVTGVAEYIEGSKWIFIANPEGINARLLPNAEALAVTDLG